MKNKWMIVVLLISSTIGCNKDDGGGISVPLQNEVNEFVWLGMNAYYYWVADVEDLSLEKYRTYNALYEFLNTYSEPEALFDDLLYEGDLFSWIVDDYEELEASFQGTSKSFGYELGLVNPIGTNQVYGYVKYVVPNGPAANAGIVRGDLFTKVDGTQLNLDNYISLLFESESYTITMAQLQDNTLSPTGEEVSMVAVELTENPIFLSDILEVEGLKVGYLVYNQFVNNNTYHAEMNTIFGEFKSAGINDLILDLRYNRGGSVTTARILASLIYGNGTTSTVFTSARYNDNIESVLVSAGVDLNDYFLNGIPGISVELNRLNINRIFILTSGNTASASELIISGLDPYMDVTLVGTTTVGKNLGSQTLYDSPNRRKTPDNSNVNHTNPNHKYAMQPIIARFTNINDIDYSNGFDPNIEVNEIDYLENLLPLGDLEEPLLAEALAIITGTARIERKPDSGMEAIFEHEKNDIRNTILIDSEVVENLR